MSAIVTRLNEAEIIFKMYRLQPTMPVGEYDALTQTQIGERTVLRVGNNFVSLTYPDGFISYYQEVNNG